MKPLTLDDLILNDEHEQTRDFWERRINKLRNSRRIPLGSMMTVLFESRELIHWQVQEICHLERITDDEERADELECYNPLIPGQGELLVTLMIEIEDPGGRDEMLTALKGFERHVTLEVGDTVTPAESVVPDDADDGTAVTHFLKFRLSPEAVTAFAGDAEARIVLRHSAREAVAEIAGGLRAALARELASD